MTAVAIVALLVPFSGCTGDPDDGNGEVTITLNLGVPNVSPRNTGTAMLHDAEMAINKVTPKDERPRWSDFTIVIKSSDGSVLLPVTSLKEDTGIYGDSVEVWYSDTTGGRDVANAGDGFVVSGMDAASYEGATVQILHNDKLAGSSVLPTDFP